MRGTVQLKKNNWDEAREVSIPDTENDTVTDAFHYDVTNAFRTSSSSINSRESLSPMSSSLHSVKLYPSTPAHVLLQERSKYPLNFKDMYGVGKRSFESLQMLARNLGAARKRVFDVARRCGSRVRIEVSIRPHHDDSLRNKGHINDFLLIACISIFDLCRGYKPKIIPVSIAEVETEAMRLISQMGEMVKYRHSTKFEEIWGHKKGVSWLRFHVSLILLTIGISPEFGVKYINQWLDDETRFDPYKYIAQEAPRDPMDMAMGSLKSKLGQLGFSGECGKKLINFLRSRDNSNLRSFYTELTLEEKHGLAHHLSADIIPHMQSLICPEENQPTNFCQEDQGEPFNRNTMNEYEGDWEPDPGEISGKMLDDDGTDVVPTHPLATSIRSLVKLGTLWDPTRRIFNQILCSFILRCHETNPIRDSKTQHLLQGCSLGRTTLSNTDLCHICFGLGLISSPSRREAFHKHQKRLCERYKFPREGDPLSTSDEESSLSTGSSNHAGIRYHSRINKLLNEVFLQDRAVLISSIGSIWCTFHRILEDTYIRIPANVFDTEVIPTFEGKHQDRDPFILLGRSLNASYGCNIRLIFQDYFDQANEKNIENKFLTSEGIIDDKFCGMCNYGHVLEKYNFMQSSNDMLADLIPEVIMAIACVVYEVNITFYRADIEKTQLFYHHKKRSIKYSVDGVKVAKRFTSLIIRWNNGAYEWKDIKFTKNVTEGRGQLSQVFSCSPLGGDLLLVNRLDQVSLHTRKRCCGEQSFHDALSKLLGELDANYVLPNHSDDSIGLRPFIEQLISCSGYTSEVQLFSELIRARCSQLSLPMRALSALLDKENMDNFGHELLCPVTCLKYSNLTLGVIEKGKGKNNVTTYFYAYNTISGCVECRHDSGYRILSNGQVSRNE